MKNPNHKPLPLCPRLRRVHDAPPVPPPAPLATLPSHHGERGTGEGSGRGTTGGRAQAGVTGGKGNASDTITATTREPKVFGLFDRPVPGITSPFPFKVLVIDSITPTSENHPLHTAALLALIDDTTRPSATERKAAVLAYLKRACGLKGFHMTACPDPSKPAPTQEKLDQSFLTLFRGELTGDIPFRDVTHEAL